MMIVAPVNKSRRLKFNSKSNDNNMLKIVKKPKSDIPAITHVNYSARIQTIEKDDHKKYYDLIKSFETKTKYGIIINTSFNIRGEPIVNTPYDAYKCFMNTEMDILFLEDHYLIKEDQKKEKKEKKLIKKKIPKEDKKLKTKLNNLYFNKLNSLTYNSKKFDTKKSLWEDYNNKFNIKNIFEIPEELMKESVNEEEFTNAMLNYWKKNSLSKNLKPMIIDLIKLSKKYPIDEEFEESVSDKIYEMF